MQNSRTYYGGAFLGEEDLKETNINHRIELEYYTTTNKETNDSYDVDFDRIINFVVSHGFS